MREYGFSLTRILPYKNKILVSENPYFMQWIVYPIIFNILKSKTFLNVLFALIAVNIDLE